MITYYYSPFCVPSRRSSSGPSDKELLSPYSLFMNDTSYRLQNSGEKMHSLYPEHIFINIHIHMSHEQPVQPDQQLDCPGAARSVINVCRVKKIKVSALKTLIYGVHLVYCWVELLCMILLILSFGSLLLEHIAYSTNLDVQYMDIKCNMKSRCRR